MRIVSVAFALALLGISGCSGPQVARADDVIAMKDAGADEATLLQWVYDPQRTFDLSWEDARKLMSAGVSQSVIDAMRAKSEEYHKAKGHAGGSGAGPSSGHHH
ncbi:MAG: hypothetical protein HYY16_18060 [Planctomycetes bacterium]|nr:hypothetical protein [Planctomycetota bacterium]